MSILLKAQIIKEVKNGRIIIKPYDVEQLGPNSYDVRLSPILKIYSFEDSDHLDCKKDNPTKTIEIDEHGYILQPGILYLGSTVEQVGSDFYIPMYEGRSSMARLGIQSHLSAGFGDVGFKTNWTLEICVPHKTKIYPYMRIGQIYFHPVNETYNHCQYRYNGKYKKQKEAQASKSHLDFINITLSDQS